MEWWLNCRYGGVALFFPVMQSAPSSNAFKGLGLLAVRAHFPSLKLAKCNIYDPKSQCQQIKGCNAILLYVALTFVAFGVAGVKAGLPTHSVDQFDENDTDEEKEISTFFNWLFLSDCIGGAISLIIMVWVQNNLGWDWGFGASAILVIFGISVFVAGVSRYRFHILGGFNPIVEIIQVYFASIRNRNLELPKNSEDLYEFINDKESVLEHEFIPHSNTYRFLDKAAIQPS